MKKYAIALCAASLLLSGSSCTGSDPVTSTNNVLANLSGGVTLATFQVGCGIVRVAESYYPTSNPNPTPAEALAVSTAEAVVNSLCANPPTNLTIAFDDLKSAWDVIQAGATKPTPANPTPSVPPLVVKSIPTPTPTSN